MSPLYTNFYELTDMRYLFDCLILINKTKKTWNLTYHSLQGVHTKQDRQLNLILPFHIHISTTICEIHYLMLWKVYLFKIFAFPQIQNIDSGRVLKIMCIVYQLLGKYLLYYVKRIQINKVVNYTYYALYDVIFCCVFFRIYV